VDRPQSADSSTERGQYANFEDIRNLQTTELRQLLREGEPVVRAWAGWELGLRIGRAADADLADAARATPTPGVRRLLLVILAGHGERELLDVFALNDPDGDVRATAAQYLGKTSGRKDGALDEMLAGLLSRDTSPVVRWQVLALAKEGRAEIPKPLIEACVPDADARVRRIAAEVLLGDAAPGEFPAVLESRPVVEENDELRDFVTQALISSGGAHRLLRALAERPSTDVRRVSELLSAIARNLNRFPWEELIPLAARGPSVSVLVAALLNDAHSPGAFTWLVDVALSDQHFPDREELHPVTSMYQAAAVARERLAEAVDRVDSAAVPLRARPAVVRLAAELESFLEEERHLVRWEDGVELDDLAPAEQPPWYSLNAKLLRGLRGIIASWSE
jgi:hypothetical protein